MKKILRKVFNKLGYDIIKVNVHSADKAKKVINVQVGNYKLLMPQNNAQISLYKYSGQASQFFSVKFFLPFSPASSPRVKLDYPL